MSISCLRTLKILSLSVTFPLVVVVRVYTTWCSLKKLFINKKILSLLLRCSCCREIWYDDVFMSPWQQMMKFICRSTNVEQFPLFELSIFFLFTSNMSTSMDLTEATATGNGKMRMRGILHKSKTSTDGIWSLARINNGWIKNTSQNISHSCSVQRTSPTTTDLRNRRANSCRKIEYDMEK